MFLEGMQVSAVYKSRDLHLFFQQFSCLEQPYPIYARHTRYFVAGDSLRSDTP
jgi:hypothetical protein